MGIAIQPVKEPVEFRLPAKSGIKTRTGRAPPDLSQEKPSGESLPALLSLMGITGLAYKSLMEREDLLDDPSPVLACWWYALSQEEVQRPARVAVHALATCFPPRNNYLELAQTWPQVTAGHRAQIEESLQHYPGCQTLSDRWSPIYPGLTPGAFVAFIGLYAAAPMELGYAQANGQWAEVFKRRGEGDQRTVVSYRSPIPNPQLPTPRPQLKTALSALHGQKSPSSGKKGSSSFTNAEGQIWWE